MYSLSLPFPLVPLLPVFVSQSLPLLDDGSVLYQEAGKKEPVQVLRTKMVRNVMADCDMIDQMRWRVLEI